MRVLMLLLMLASPAMARLPTSTVTSTPTRTATPTATATGTITATSTITNTPTVTNTPASTATITPTRTITLTPTAYVIYNREGRINRVPSPLPTDALVVVMPNGNDVGVYLDGRIAPGSGGGGGTPTPCLKATVLPTPGDATASTGNQLAAGKLVNQCIATTTTAISGGYEVGLAGASDLWGTVGGTLSSSNALTAYMPNPLRIVTSEAVVFTAAGGTFPPTPGAISVSCTCGD